MANIKNNAAAQDTRRRLIDSAGQVFAEKGLHAATLQEITERASANKASVNYHFRDKLELYAVVVRFALTPPAGQELPEVQDLKGPPEAQLATLINGLMRDLIEPRWRATIIAHELAQPTSALDAVMNDLIQPKMVRMNHVVRGILGSNASEELVARATVSVVSQCLFYLQGQQIIHRVFPILNDEDPTLEKAAAHATEFSLAALRALKRRLGSRQTALL